MNPTNAFMETRRQEIRRERRLRLVLCAVLFLAICLVSWASWGDVPRQSLQYRSDTIRTTRVIWGMDGPVAVFAAQIQQESGWNPAAHSAVADGLAEFTPATATWISGAYHLGPAEPYNPGWALRALVTYDLDLWQHVDRYPPLSATGCDHMAFTLAAYNGGIGWVPRDRAVAADAGITGEKWFGAVALFSHRSPAAFKENRGYPKRILIALGRSYAAWGPAIDCSVVMTRAGWSLP